MDTQHLSERMHTETEYPANRGEIERGRVTAVLGESLAVTHADGATVARRAASCLLAPQPGDVVLVARVEGRAYVLAVLEREGAERAIDVDGDLVVRSRAGSVRVRGEQEVSLRAGGRLVATGQTVALAAETASWVAERLQLIAESLSTEAVRMHQAASFSERVIESAKETLGSSYRHVREAEHVQAESLTFSLRKLFRTHAETAVITAKKLAKIDADQIHLG